MSRECCCHPCTICTPGVWEIGEDSSLAFLTKTPTKESKKKNCGCHIQGSITDWKSSWNVNTELVFLLASNAFSMKVLHSLIFSGQIVEASGEGKECCAQLGGSTKSLYSNSSPDLYFKENISSLSLHLNCEIFLSEKTLISMLFWWVRWC